MIILALLLSFTVLPILALWDKLVYKHQYMKELKQAYKEIWHSAKFAIKNGYRISDIDNIGRYK